MTNSQKAILALILANIIWGAAAPIFKWALENIEPFTLAFLRFALATLIIIPFLKVNELKIQKDDILKIFLLAFSGVTINIGFFFLALTLTASINAPIIASSAPIFIIIGSIFLLREHPGMRKIIGGIIGLMGVLTIVLLPVLENGIDGSIFGNIFLIVATIASVLHVITLKELTPKYSPLSLVFWTFSIGALTFLPLLLYEVSQSGFLSNIDIKGFIGITYGAIFTSVIAYSFLHFATKYVLASEVGLFLYIDPIIAIVIAAPLLGEIPSSTFLIGAFLVFLGIYIAEGRIHYHPFHRLKEDR